MGGKCLKCHKRGGTEKRGGDTKILKRGGQAWGALKEGGLEPPNDFTNVIFSGTLWRDK